MLFICHFIIINQLQEDICKKIKKATKKEKSMKNKKKKKAKKGRIGKGKKEQCKKNNCGTILS